MFQDCLNFVPKDRYRYLKGTISRTVPRAELTATIAAVTHHKQAPSFTDAAYVAAGANKPPEPEELGRCSPNADLWRLWHAAEHRGRVYKVKAHRCLSGIKQEELLSYIGNNLADLFAGTAAQLSQLDSLSKESLEKIHTVAFMCAMRLGICEVLARQAWQRRTTWNALEMEEELTMMSGKQRLLQQLSAMGHSLAKVGPKLRCRNCAVTKPRSQLKHFLLTKCEDGSSLAAQTLSGRQCTPEPARTTTEWNSHRLRWTAVDPASCRCEFCRMQGGLSAFQEHCRAGQGPQLAKQGLLEGIIEGTPRHAAAENEKIRGYNRMVRTCNTENLQSAAASIVHDLEDNQAEAHMPRWLIQIVDGHNLYFCKSLAFCAACGGVASAKSSSALLIGHCRRTLPEGSKSRLRRALSGRHPHAQQSCWPDGSSAKEKGKVYKVTPACLQEVEVQVDVVLGQPLPDEETAIQGQNGADERREHIAVRVEEQDTPGASSSADSLGGERALLPRVAPQEPPRQPRQRRIDRSRFKF